MMSTQVTNLKRSVRKLGVFVLTALSLSGSGNLWAQASIDADVTIVKGEAVRISNIDDWLIGVFTSTDSIANIQYNWDWQCVHTTTGSYQVEVISQNGGSQLTLASGANTMRYEIYSFFRRGNNYVGPVRHTDPNFTISNLSGSTQVNCSDEPSNTNLWFAALVRPNAFNAAPPGIYQDLATLIVSPE